MRNKHRIALILSAVLVATCLEACAGVHSGISPALEGGANPFVRARVIAVSPAIHRRPPRSLIEPGVRHLFPRRGEAALIVRPHTQANLTYHGGPVQTTPAIYLIFWGFSNPPWTDSTHDPDGMASYLYNFLSDLDCSSWINTVTQYSEYSTTPITNPCSDWVKAVYVDSSLPPNPYTLKGVYTEVYDVAESNGVLNFNSNFILVTPTGYAENDASTFCAYHDYFTYSGNYQPFALVPYVPDAGPACGVGSVNNPGTLDGVSINAGHEQAETETDPLVNAWYDSSETAHYCSGADASAYCEIGDKCSWTDLQNSPVTGGTFPTQPLWSNEARACVQGTGTLGPVRVRPHKLRFLKTGRSYEKIVSVSQTNYAGTFRKTNTCHSIAKVVHAPGSNGIASFGVIPVGSGRCSATFTDSYGDSGSVAIVVK
ncbi:MAG: hypothetical protein JO092_06775 [Candidatus Eremiobacteraeota bacterium]|nr:hypothetical protein [Candidatus Eremiobacteraeota bacterium]MBV8374299.1 hypothetical protein [Candidatus Eremiobacteraeota bacterium]